MHEGSREKAYHSGIPGASSLRVFSQAQQRHVGGSRNESGALCLHSEP